MNKWKKEDIKEIDWAFSQKRTLLEATVNMSFQKARMRPAWPNSSGRLFCGWSKLKVLKIVSEGGGEKESS